MNLPTRLFTLVAALFLGLSAPAQAQTVAGTYGTTVASGLVAVSFELVDRLLLGRVVQGGYSYPASAQIDDGGAYGYLYLSGGALYFELEPIRDGVRLTVAELDAVTGQADPSSASSLELSPLDERELDAFPAGGLPPGSMPATPELRYEAGSRITSPSAGVSFLVPEGLYAAYSTALDRFVVLADGAPGYVIVEASSRLEAGAALRELEEWFVAGQLTVTRDGRPEVTEAMTLIRYRVESVEGVGAAYVAVITPPMGNGVIYVGIGVRGEEAWLAHQVDALSATTLMDAPIGVTEVSMRHLLADSRVAIMPAGDNDATAPAELHLCPDGSYRYATVGAPPGGPSFEHVGSWTVLGSLLGSDLLLERSDGEPPVRLTVMRRGDEFFGEGRPWVVGTGAVCG